MCKVITNKEKGENKMKKNLIALMTVVSILASGAAVLADEIPAATIEPTADKIMNVPAQPDTPFEDRIQGDVMLISGDTPVDAPVSIPSYVSKTVTVTEIGDGRISTTVNAEDKENPENTINYTVTDDTIVLGYANGAVKDVKDIKAGDKITVYSNAYAPAPLILPPQYQADVIFVEDNLELDSLRFADVDTYLSDGETLVNAANTLALNIDKDTEIVDREGKKVEADKIANKDLAVVYMSSTKSIPAQTTPIKIVVLGDNETALKQIEAAKNEANATPAPTVTPEATTAPENTDVILKDVKSVKIGDKSIENIYFKEDQTLMVPLRSIAESLNFTVEWDGELKAVMLNSGIYSIKIGENAYVKGRMMPQQLSSAPEIKSDDLTYVPFEYFTEILEADATNSGNVVELKYSSTEAE